MEKAKKNLKDVSLLVLIFAGLAFFKLIVHAFTGAFVVSESPEIFEGMPVETAQTIAKILQIFIWCVGILVLIPQLFVGLRGLKNAEGPMDKLGHVTWAKVLFVFAIIATISSFADLISAKDVLISILGLISSGIDAVAFFLFVKCANQVNKA